MVTNFPEDIISSIFLLYKLKVPKTYKPHELLEHNYTIGTLTDLNMYI